MRMSYHDQLRSKHKYENIYPTYMEVGEFDIGAQVFMKYHYKPNLLPADKQIEMRETTVLVWYDALPLHLEKVNCRTQSPYVETS